MIQFTSVLQYQFHWYNTVNYCKSTNSTDTIWSTTVPVSISLIGYSPPMLQYQFYWYNTVFYCVSTSPTDTVRCYPSTSPTDTLQFTTTPVPALLTSYNPLLLQYQSYWYDTVHFLPQYYMDTSVYNCPSTRPTDTLVHYCSSASPIDRTQYTSGPVPVLHICYWYVTVHCWPSTNPTHTWHSTTALISVLLISHSTLRPQYLLY